MKVVECLQGSEAWFKARCGIPSASSFDSILCADGKVSRQRTKYLYQLAGESITGIAEETYTNGAMERGKIMEDEARQLYSLITGEEVKQVGFCLTDGFGASPDGLVGDKGLLEIKCPKLATHVGYLLDNVLPADYFQQTQGQLLVTGKAWVDFMSYYPAMNPLIIRVTPDKEFQKALNAELIKFCAELEEVVKKIGG